MASHAENARLNVSFASEKNVMMFSYVVARDYGFAPNPFSGWCTLATCKPKIRRNARPGDWVVGFLPRPHPRGLIVYAGRILQTLEVGSYERRHRGRSDAGYRERTDGSFKRLRPEYHSNRDEIRKDLSSPVLIFDPGATWYFGDRPQDLPPNLSHLAAAGLGHRVNGANEEDIAAFEVWLRSNWPPGIGTTPISHRKRRPSSIVRPKARMASNPACG